MNPWLGALTACVIAIAAALCLGGCNSQVGMFVVGDAQTAIAIASATPATAGDVPCFQNWNSIAMAVNGPSARMGLISLVELKRAALITLGSPACAPVTVMLANDLLKLGAGPFGGLVP